MTSPHYLHLGIDPWSSFPSSAAPEGSGMPDQVRHDGFEVEGVIGVCTNCCHPIGYHHGGTEPQMYCTCDGCDCPGYRDAKIDSPQTGPEKSEDA